VTESCVSQGAGLAVTRGKDDVISSLYARMRASVDIDSFIFSSHHTIKESS
jgi:hypothetical protein